MSFLHPVMGEKDSFSDRIGECKNIKIPLFNLSNGHVWGHLTIENLKRSYPTYGLFYTTVSCKVTLVNVCLEVIPGYFDQEVFQSLLKIISSKNHIFRTEIEGFSLKIGSDFVARSKSIRCTDTILYLESDINLLIKKEKHTPRNGAFFYDPSLQSLFWQDESRKIGNF